MVLKITIFWWKCQWIIECNLFNQCILINENEYNEYKINNKHLNIKYEIDDEDANINGIKNNNFMMEMSMNNWV